MLCIAAFLFIIGGWDMKKIVEIKNITKSFDGEVVLDNINLDIYDNEFITLLGPSGCGKTTLLRIIGGFETPDSGDVIFMGENINGLPPHKRNVNTVFQRYALFPHLNVFENVAFSLREKKVPKAEIQKAVTEMLSLVALKGFEKRAVTSLSGGQQQRVAIARALVNQPKVLLLDEPLSALDLKLRKDMQVELKNIQKATGITFIFVTHDQEEALSMSDTVVVMTEGHIQQIGTPVDIYNEPQNAFVADFIGESNILDGVMLEDYKVRFSGHTFQCLDKDFDPREAVDVVVRPEDVDIVPEEKGHLRGIVTSVTLSAFAARSEAAALLSNADLSTRFCTGLALESDSALSTVTAAGIGSSTSPVCPLTELTPPAPPVPSGTTKLRVPSASMIVTRCPPSTSVTAIAGETPSAPSKAPLSASARTAAASAIACPAMAWI